MTKCVLCENKGIKKRYIGETSLSIFERAKLHHNDVFYNPEGSHILAHIAEDHPEITDTREIFKIEILVRLKTPLARELDECFQKQQVQVT